MSFTRDTLVVFGSINQDIFLNVPAFPEPGQTLLATGSSRAIGGKGANQAIAGALAGTSTVMVGAVGDDSSGVQARTALNDAGVDVVGVTSSQTYPTGTAHIYVRSDGENTIVVDSGANGEVRGDQFSELSRDGVAWCLLSVEVPEEQAMDCARRAREGGSKVALNASPGLSAPLDSTLIDLLVVNAGETTAIVGQQWSALGNLADYLGIEAVVVTLGGDGAQVHHAGQPVQVVPARKVDVRDTTGCGDAFAGVLLSRLCRGESYVDSAAAATIFAGEVAQYPGASSSYAAAFAAVDASAGSER